MAVVRTRGKRGEDEGKKGGMERGKNKTQTNSKHIRGERQLFQFEGDEKSTMISPV